MRIGYAVICVALQLLNLASAKLNASRAEKEESEAGQAFREHAEAELAACSLKPAQIASQIEKHGIGRD